MAKTVVRDAVHYQVGVNDLNNHLFQVTLTVRQPAALQRLALPVWIPGSYLIREFSKNLQCLEATQNGKKLRVQQLDKACWQVACNPQTELKITYEVYAFDASVRTAWLDTTRGFFNGTSLFLRVEGLEKSAHTVAIAPPDNATGWSLATGLAPHKVDRRGFGVYRAADFDELVDCPVEMGAFWSGSFIAGGIPHRFVVSGATDAFDGAKLLEDTKAICETEIAFWHGKNPGKNLPFSQYLFMLNAVHDGYGGLEHRNSTALICTRKDLPRALPATAMATAKKPVQPEGYTTLLGLISHEYFHTWNVKRLRPAELATIDYSRECFTELLWFFEGFTSYYDDLLLRRAGCIDNATYLKLLSKTMNQVQQTPGRLIQSVAQASFDAWVKYYRQDENTANATISYYTKGSLVALCLDLTLRKEGHTSLDEVMRELWKRCAGGPMKEQDVLEVLESLGKRSFAREISLWVHSTTELPVLPLLKWHGVEVHQDADSLALQLGLRAKEAGGLTVQQVLRGGVAEKAGLAAGDEWLAVQAYAAKASGPWRMQTLEDLPLYAGKAKKVRLTVARDKRLLNLLMDVPKPSQSVRLGTADEAKVNAWLTGSSRS